MIIIRILLCAICLFLLYILYSSSKLHEGLSPSPELSPSPSIDIISNLKVNADNGQVEITGTISNPNGNVTVIEVKEPNGTLVKRIIVTGDNMDFTITPTELAGVEPLTDNVPVTLYFIPISKTGLILSEKKEISFNRSLLEGSSLNSAPSTSPYPSTNSNIISGSPNSADSSTSSSPDTSTSGSADSSTSGSAASSTSGSADSSTSGSAASSTLGSVASSSSTQANFEAHNKMDGLLIQKTQEIAELKEELEKLQNMTCIPKPQHDALNIIKSKNNKPTIRTRYQKFY